MSRTHEHYEKLCLLAATGQMPDSEMEAFCSHLASCAACRWLVKDFEAIGGQLLRSVAEKRVRNSVPEGMTARFIARARSEGLTITGGFAERNPPLRNPPLMLPIRKWVVASLVATLAVAVGLGLTLHRLRPAGQIPVIAANAVTGGAGSNIGAVSRIQELQSEVELLRRELAQSNARDHELSARIEADRNIAATAAQGIESLKSELEGVGRENAVLRAKEHDRSTHIAKLEGELDQMRSIKSAGDIALLAQENDLRALRQSLSEKESTLRQQQHMADAGSQARDLIVARNLHIIDVYDRDGDGNKQKAFGRIFYTEGKSLIFYAYDLADPQKIDQRVSFYAWGEHLNGGQAVKQLGIFHNEDVNEGRWVLTFDDPRVLAQINSVFVTVEEGRRNVARPQGKKILFAFLGNKANHP